MIQCKVCENSVESLTGHACPYAGHSSLVDEIYDKLECVEPLTKEYIRITLSDVSLFDRKHHDYGPSNHAMFGERGVMIRLWDKVSRLKRLVWDDLTPKNEAIDDSWSDASVYGVIARMIRKGVWR